MRCIVMMGRVMAVDPGSKNLGIALSDPRAMLARPLTIVKHTNLEHDCQVIIELADVHDARLILVGQALGDENEQTPQARHAVRLANKLSELTTIKIELWDESYSTNHARTIGVRYGEKRSKRSGHLDDEAAAVILQSYLDSISGVSAQ